MGIASPSYALRIMDCTGHKVEVRVLLQSVHIIECIPAIKRTMPSSILAAIRSLSAASMIAVNAISKMYAASFAMPILINVITFFHAACCHIR
jgi:hypothetical protein